jgi:hypothetical protein
MAACVATGMNVGNKVTPSFLICWREVNMIIEMILTCQVHSRNAGPRGMAFCDNFELHVPKCRRDDASKALQIANGCL